MDFINGMRPMRGICPITITAPPENRELSDTIAAMLRFPERLTSHYNHLDNTYLQLVTIPVIQENIYPVQLWPMIPRFYDVRFIPPVSYDRNTVDADATPTPTPQVIVPQDEIIVHARPDTPNADAIYQLLLGLRLNAVPGTHYPADANPNVSGLAYVQFGTGWL